MQQRHFPHRQSTSASGKDPAPDDAGRSYDPRVFAVQRVGAVVVALVILVFGLLGLAGGLGFFSTDGEPVLGMSSNGLLSTVSVLTAVVLLAAALRGPRVASTVMIVVGSLFLVSALVNLAVLRTSFNLLAFEMTNVAFSVAAGLVLLLLGAYGRLTGNLPADSPYAHRPTAARGLPVDARGIRRRTGHARRRDRRREPRRDHRPAEAGRRDGPGAHPSGPSPGVDGVRRTPLLTRLSPPSPGQAAALPAPPRCRPRRGPAVRRG
jgi:hypothetical protein